MIWIHWTSSCFELIAHSQALRRAPLPLRALVSLLPRAADIGNSPILKALASRDSDLSTALEEEADAGDDEDGDGDDDDEDDRKRRIFCWL